jgi:hypothetical protein
VPVFDLKKVQGIPIIMASGVGDLLADIRDVRRLHNELKNEIVFYREYDFGHLTFLVSENMDWLRNDIMNEVKKYYPSTMLICI